MQRGRAQLVGPANVVAAGRGPAARRRKWEWAQGGNGNASLTHRGAGKELNKSINPDEAVAYGAAVQVRPSSARPHARTTHVCVRVRVYACEGACVCEPLRPRTLSE
jgi:hypothetical protein